MRVLKAALIAVLLLAIGAAFAATTRGDDGGAPVSITLTKAQVDAVKARTGATAIALTQDQINIVVHNFPRYAGKTLTLTTADIGSGNMVSIVVHNGEAAINK